MSGPAFSQAGEKCSLHIAYIFLMQLGWEMVGTKSVGRWTDCSQRQDFGATCAPGGEGKGIPVGIQCRGCCGHGHKELLWSWHRCFLDQ